MNLSSYQTAKLKRFPLNQMYPHKRGKNCPCVRCKTQKKQAQLRLSRSPSQIQEIEEERTVALTKTMLSWTGPHPIGRDSSGFSGGGIYVVTRNGKPIYVGQTVNFRQRFNIHFSSLYQMGCDVRQHKIYLGKISLANGSPVTARVRKNVESVIIRTYLKNSVRLQNRTSIKEFKTGSGGLFIFNKGSSLPPGLKKFIKHPQGAIYEIPLNDQHKPVKSAYQDRFITRLSPDEKFEFDEVFYESSLDYPDKEDALELRRRSRKTFVRWVQSSLNQVLGLRLRISGAMNTATRNALRDFQNREDLPIDGNVGPEVEQALGDALWSGLSVQDKGEASEFEFLELEAPTGLPILRRGSRGTAVADLQRRLSSAGFNAGTADGIFGSNTDAAVRAFQRSHGLHGDGIVGSMTWGALLNEISVQPTPRGGTSYVGRSTIRYGKGWGGSEGVADVAKAIAGSMGIPVTSEKRNLEDTIRVGSSTGSDHYTGNTNAFATDLGVSGSRGDELASAIAAKYGIPQSVIGTYRRTTIQVQDRQYSLQLLWKVTGHYDHVHFGIRRA